jgi:phospholipid-binding lipoprotein MlaA
MSALGLIETRANLLPADRMLDDALDRYLLVRDGYLARRRNLVYDGNPPDKD